ncbi:MAG: SAM-dependent methyltransferase, partial [Verrucomicrobiota bacterium]
MESISFSQFMANALYDPVKGYYSRTPQIGRKGDFFTAVSVGSSFGQIIAYQVVEAWYALDNPEPFHLIEQGAHDGSLAKDIMEELKLLEPDCFHAVQMILIEPLDSLRKLQSEKLRELSVPLQYFKSWDEVPANSLHGFFYSNELVDSFPVDLVTFQNGKWFEKRVAIDPTSTGWMLHLEEIKKDDPLQGFLERIPSIEGYTTEIHRQIEPWMTSVLQGLKAGVILIVDYGYPESQYYMKERTCGTLQTYRLHEKSDDPLVDVGEQDITAHVNFTMLYQSALHQGANLIGCTDQGR